MRRVLYLRVRHLQTTLERQWDPTLRDRPLVVVGRPATDAFCRRKAGSSPFRLGEGPARRDRSSIVLDASPEAEAEGVAVGMTERHARRRCPEAWFLSAERARYEPAAVMIGDCLAAETPWVERQELFDAGRISWRGAAAPRAQDEFFADLGSGDAEEGVEIARRVAERLSAKLGLEAQPTLATSRFVARAVGPGPLLIPEGAERRALRALPIDALLEAPVETRRRMRLLGLRTLGQLAAVPQRRLIEQFGPVGRWYGMLARGVDPRGVRVWNPAPAITAACDLPDATTDRTILEAALCRLAARLARQLVREGRYGRRMTLTLILKSGCRLHATRALKEPTNLARALARTGGALLELATRGPSPFRVGEGFTTLALAVSELESHGALQLSIFGDVERGPALRAAVARLQERFGEAAVVVAARLVPAVIGDG